MSVTRVPTLLLIPLGMCGLADLHFADTSQTSDSPLLSSPKRGGDTSPLRREAPALAHTLRFLTLNIAQVNPTLELMWREVTTESGITPMKANPFIVPAACIYQQTGSRRGCDLVATRPSTLTGLKGQNGTRERLQCHSQLRPNDMCTPRRE